MTKRKNPEDLQKRGPKEFITPELQDRALTLFKMGLCDEEVCDTLDITPSVLYRFQNNHPKFKEKKDLAKNHLVAKARRELYAGLSSKDPKLRVQVAQWILERKKKDEFGKADTEINLGLSVEVKDNKSKDAIEDLWND